MNLKKGLILLALVSLLTAGNVFAHDKGDLMLHIEPQLIFSFPTIGEPIKETDEIYGYYSNAGGIGISFRVRVMYWFSDFLGISAGLGGSGYLDTWEWGYTREDSYYNKRSKISGDVVFTRGYFTIPLGANFSLSALAIGAGFSFNILLDKDATASGFDKEKYDWFYLKDYFGWYFDFGFDRSGRTDAGGGFGMLLRLAGSLGNDLAGFNLGRNHSEKLPYQDFSISMVFSPAIQLANLPIGGKK